MSVISHKNSLDSVLAVSLVTPRLSMLIPAPVSTSIVPIPTIPGSLQRIRSYLSPVNSDGRSSVVFTLGGNLPCWDI